MDNLTHLGIWGGQLHGQLNLHSFLRGVKSMKNLTYLCIRVGQKRARLGLPVYFGGVIWFHPPPAGGGLALTLSCHAVDTR